MIVEEIQALEQQIQARQWKTAPDQRLWGGADVIVCTEKTDELDRWYSESRLVIDLNAGPQLGRQLVISSQAAAISTLFEKLATIFHDRIDYVNKYRFYGRLAQAANAQLKIADDRTVLLAIVDEAKRLALE